MATISRASQSYAEVLTTATTIAARSAQVYVEVLTSNTVIPARASQIYAEVLASNEAVDPGPTPTVNAQPIINVCC